MKKITLLPALLVTSFLLFTSAEATTIKFAFDGGFSMINQDGDGTPLAGITGSMSLNISADGLAGPYSGSAYMEGDEPFLGFNWSADGDITGYQNLFYGGAPGYCGDHAMCADASMNFYWGGTVIPLEAAFGMDPSLGVDIHNPVTSILNGWLNGDLAYFNVESLDADGDGIPGTQLTGAFAGLTPYFTGIAIVTEICEQVEVNLLGKITIVEECTSMPQGYKLPEAELSIYHPAPVPVPAAAWLFGSGLLGLVGFARRKRNVA